MKIKKLDEWSPKELLIFSVAFILVGLTLGFFLENRGIAIQILSILIMFTGVIFLGVSISKLLMKLEQRGKIEIIREKPPANLKEFILIIVIPLLVSISIDYWFYIRPQRIRIDCLKEAARTNINIVGNEVSSSSTNDFYEKIYQECLDRHGLKK